MKAKVHTLKFTKSGMTATQTRNVKGTLAELNEYYGKNCKTVRSLISQVNKDYSFQYACCYTVASVELVTEATA